MSVLTFPFRVAWFVLWFIGQIVISAGAVVKDVLTPGQGSTPRVVRLPLSSEREVHTGLLGMFITLTPGTLTLGVVEDQGPSGQAMIVHSMYDDDAEAALVGLREMERRTIAAFSLRGGAR